MTTMTPRHATRRNRLAILRSEWEVMFAAAATLLLTACTAAPQPLIDNPMIEVPSGWFTNGCLGMAIRNGPRIYQSRFEAAAQLCVRTAVFRQWAPSFAMNRYPITRAAFAECIAAGACRREASRRELAPSRNAPVFAAFDEARAYCVWKGADLPTSDQRQRAARGDTDRIFPWGDTPPTASEQPCLSEIDAPEECESGRTPVHLVGGDSPYGIAGLFGQAYEWRLGGPQRYYRRYWEYSADNPNEQPAPALGEFTDFDDYRVWRLKLDRLTVTTGGPYDDFRPHDLDRVGGMAAFGIEAPMLSFFTTTINAHRERELTATFRCVEARPSEPSPIEGASFPRFGPVFDERTWDMSDPKNPKPPASWKLPPEISQP